jgi:hypothetical protein
VNSSTGTGNAVLGPGQWKAWVNEHGAHLLDYAAYHLGPDRATAAAAAAVASCGARPAPGNVSVRARLLAVLRRDCFTRPGHRDGYVPGTGPGMPGALLIEQGWGLADPLGTETLRLMFRHELTSEDLAHVLALPVEEVDRLATRTQDIIETLVSALDGLAHGRPTCPELRALAASAFPGDASERSDGPGGSDGPGHAREELLAHIVRCPSCTRPINIRYTVPQMISHPPLPPLTPEAGARILDALPAASAPTAAAGPPRASLPAPRRGTSPYPSPSAPPHPKPSAAAPPRGERTIPPRGERTVPLAAPVPPAAPAPPAASAPPAGREHDTPLYDALLSQIASRTGRANLDVPLSIPSSTGPPGTARDPEHPHDGVRMRFAEALTWAGNRFRTTTLKIVVIVVAGTAGTLTGMNLLGPVGGERPTGALPSSTPQAATTAAPSPPAAFPEESALAVQEGTLAARVPLPVEVTLDEYGRGSVTLTVTSGDPLTWRAAAPGLVVSPSAGTLKRGDTSVITLRALRVRHWCGPAPFVTVPLTLHGPDDSISTTVRWRTC